MAPRSGFYKKRYRKKTLKKSNIFSKKSAKSQARQIYALNKKVNRLEYKTKPEIITQSCPFVNRVFTTDGNLGSYSVKEYHTRVYLYEEKLFGECNYDIKGKLLRPYNITITGLFENKNHNVEMSEKIYTPPLNGYLRFVVCKLNGGNQGKYPSNICKSYGETPDIGLINGPLIDDITASLKIVKNKVIKIDNVKDNRMFKIKIRNPGTYRIGDTSDQSIPPAFKNEYLIYIQYFCPDHFYLDGYTGLQPVAPVQRLTSGIKFAFVDEN